MSRIWAVTRQTFVQCVRTKIGVIFFVLLALTLMLTPQIAGNDKVPLADRIRSFLAYSITICTLELTIVTVLLTASLISGDVRTKQVFTVAVKPLARWQYVLGRWLGVVLLDAVLLAVAGTAIYTIAQHLRGQPVLSGDDRRAVESEVFVARERRGPDYSEWTRQIDAEVEKKIKASQQDHSYERDLEKYKSMTGGDAEKADQMLRDQIRKEKTEQRCSVPPGGLLEWTFNNIHLAGGSAEAQGKVVRLDPKESLYLIEAPRATVEQLLYGQPVRINGVDARVEAAGGAGLVVRFAKEDLGRGGVATLQPGDTLKIEIDPVVQVVYKPTPAKAPPSGTMLTSLWEVRTPTPDKLDKKENFYMERFRRDDAPNLPSTMTVSGRAVGSDGQMVVSYLNARQQGQASQTSVSIKPGDISVMYPVGSFETNFARGMVMVLIVLMFVAALGTFAGSFLSFPVASMLVFAILPVTVARDFLSDAIRAMPEDAGGPLFRAVWAVLRVVLPDMDSLWVSGKLVDGIRIEWDASGLIPVAYTMAGVVLILGLTCLVYGKRELARVQV